MNRPNMASKATRSIAASLGLALACLTLVMTSQPAAGEIPRDIPRPLQKALLEVVESGKKNLINSRMFNVIYYELGLCPTCDSATMQVELQKAKQAMIDAGDDVAAHYREPLYSLHVNEVKESYRSSVEKDLLSVRLAKSGKESYERSSFISCLDFVKAVADRAIANGMSARNLRFYWTMDKARYQTMCPKADGQPAIPPRPFVHTLLAFRHDRKWYAMNVEMNLNRPMPEVFYLGRNLPQRLNAEYMVGFPAIAAGKALIFAGAYEFTNMLGPLTSQQLLNVTASGRPTNDPADFICK